MKKLEDLTIKEYEEYKEILMSDDFNIFEIMRILGIEDADKMEVSDFNKISNEIISQDVKKKPLQKYYTIKGQLYKPVLKISEIKAGQFIDFQTYMNNYKLHQVLSIFLLPTTVKRTLFGKKYITSDYNDGYDMIEMQKIVYENFKIGDAMAMADFFLNLSVKLLPIMRTSLTLEVAKQTILMERKKKRLAKKTSGSIGSKLLMLFRKS